MSISSNTIGETGVTVSQLGLGGASIAGMATKVPMKQAHATIKAALDLGLTYFDTAPFYGHGLSERLVGDGLRGVKDIVLSSKVGRILKPGAPSDAGSWADALPFTPEFDYSYDGVMRSYEASLHRLGLDRIDILYVHDIGGQTHDASNEKVHFENVMTGGYRALESLRSSGAISAFGLGVNEAEVCEAALERGQWDVFLLAGRFTLLEQEPVRSLFPKCAAQGTDIIIGGPFNSGVLVGGDSYDYRPIPEDVRARVQKLNTVCQAHQVDIAAAALQFPLAHPIVKSTIPGPRSPAEMQQIHEWWSQPIPELFWSDLRTEGLLIPEAPVPEGASKATGNAEKESAV